MLSKADETFVIVGILNRLCSNICPVIILHISLIFIGTFFFFHSKVVCVFLNHLS